MQSNSVMPAGTAVTASSSDIVSGLVVSRLIAWLLCLLTFVLIFMGALVKSHEAGLSVPDWPTTYGYNMFLFPMSEWRANVFYEHTHRLVASAVGMVTLFLCCWVAFNDQRHSVRWAAGAALAIVVLQGVLGGLTVLFLLPAYLSVAHGVLAQTFLLVAILLARAFSAPTMKQRDALEPRSASNTARWALLFTVLVWFQLVVGAVVRHTESGLAIPDFPTMGGQWFPLFDDAMLSNINAWRLEQTFASNAFLADVAIGQVAVHAAHRFGGLVLLIAYLGLLRSAWRHRVTNGYVALHAAGIGMLLAAQIVLGVLTVTTARLPLVASTHVVSGAALLAASWSFALASMHKRATEQCAPSLDATAVATG